MSHEVAANDVFKQLGDYRCEGNRAVIFREMAITLFKDGGHIGISPVRWENASVKGFLKDEGNGWG